MVVVAAAALLLAGCGEGSGGSGGSGSEGGSSGESGESEDTNASVCDSAEGDGPKIGVAYDVGGRGDLSFNDSAYEGLEKAVEEFDATCTEAEAAPGESNVEREERLRQLADAGYDPIIATGYIYSPDVAVVSQEFPQVSFAVVDGYTSFVNDTKNYVPVENAVDLNFAAEQGSFLVGVAAALKTKTGTVGFLGGVNNPLIQAFEAGFKAGVLEADPKVKVVTTYLSQSDTQKGFENRSGGKTASDGLYDDGADIVYHAAGKSGLGLFDSVAEQGEGKWAIGVDSDQYLTASKDQQPHILTSMLKRVDVSVFDYVQSFVDGEIEGGIVNYDLKGDGVGYSTSGGFVDDIEGELQDYATQIESGDIEVPTDPTKVG